MEITELNIISDFEAGMNCLQNPSMISGFFSLSGVGKVPQVYRFWKWGALILALVAAFSGVITRIKLLIARFSKVRLLASSGPLTQQLEDDYDSDEDEDDSCSSSASSDDDGYPPTMFFEDRKPVEEDYCVAGSSCYRDDHQWNSGDLRLRRRRGGGDRFSWSDFASGKSVVKLWDSLGLGLDFEEDSSRSVVSTWDLNRDQKISSFSGWNCQIPAVSTSSPSVILSAGSNAKDNIWLGVYDTRVGSQIPALFSEWRLRRGKVVGFNSGGVEKVYIRDDVTGALTLGDMRNVNSPLENPTESEGDTWWDADAVIVPEEFVEDSRYLDVTRRRDLVGCCLLWKGQKGPEPLFSVKNCVATPKNWYSANKC